jgi:hypothetical protein
MTKRPRAVGRPGSRQIKRQRQPDTKNPNSVQVPRHTGVTARVPGGCQANCIYRHCDDVRPTACRAPGRRGVTAVTVVMV